MGSHHQQVAILVPDDKLDCFGILGKKFGSDKNGLAFYPVPLLPPRADGSPYFLIKVLEQFEWNEKRGIFFDQFIDQIDLLKYLIQGTNSIEYIN